VFFLVRGCRPNARMWDLAGFGLWLAIANVVRPVNLPFVIPAVACVLLSQRSRWTWARRALGGVVMCAALGLGLLPSVVYQYATTGSASLSSNGAANLFAASSPVYKTWTPAMYDDVSNQLKARGVIVDEDSLNAEFTRLTIQNYLHYPAFQWQRVVDGFGAFGAYEGEATRVDRFTLFRPWLLIAGVLIALGLIVARRRFAWWSAAPALVLVVELVRQPSAMLVALQVAGLILPLLALRRDPRALGWLAVALFWVTTGLLAILTTGVSGFFLDRLYTQVEPERALLLALAAVEVSVMLLPLGRRARILQVIPFARVFPARLPLATRAVVWRLWAGIGLIVAVGLVRLAAINLQPPSTQLLTVPSGEQLSALAARMGLPGPVLYVEDSQFIVIRNLLMSGAPPLTQTIYAVPGEYTRFMWYLDGQDRTLFWYVFADQTRPPALDRNLITGEVAGHLPLSTYANQMGLLLVAPTSSYFDHTGVLQLQNVLTVRGFAPWDDTNKRFRLEDTQIFPLSWPLYDDAHMKAAVHQGEITDLGPIPLQVGGRVLRTLDFHPTGSANPTSLAFNDVYVPPASEFRVNVALHPRFSQHSAIGHPRVDVTLRTPDGQSAGLLDYTLDPARRSDVDFVLLQADLAQYSGQVVDITLTAMRDPTSPEIPDVLIGEPQIVTR
jgi:hypothetical protein